MKIKNKAKIKEEKKLKKKEDKKSSAGFGVLGKDLSSRFSFRDDTAWKPTRPGGRNSQGKPG